MSEFSENLKNARQASGLSQKDVADTVGVAASTYSLYESGKREPNIPIIKKISRTLNVTSDVLLGVSEPTKPVYLLPEEEALINKYRSLSFLAKERMSGMMEIEYIQSQQDTRS